ncbi:hypothetical protein SKAU_G00132700 [Synaphobranchus kaupii]|uniref:DUF4371 domain-containing protein n=1 Tax=Synaphobranchus kaupii TaxID=118154 RepID=A0A9Q1FR49_SYNKA|nr:hypothetical protein SKAU_G00132700 [Synaphobranchus kaupii]
MHHHHWMRTEEKTTRPLLLLLLLRGAEKYAIVVDETRDVCGKEQLSLSVQWVSRDYTVHEDFIGMHDFSKTDAQYITHTIEDILCWCSLDVMDMQGQTYDGASVLQGKMSGVAKRFKDKISKALSIHCLNHRLNLILQEVTSKCPISLVHDIHGKISASPKRLDIFEKMRASLSVSNPPVAAGGRLKPLCPTRWTCKTSAVKSLLDNYETVYHTLDEIVNAGGNSEAARKASGVKALMTQFEVHLGLKVSLHLFSSAEEVARVLQAKDSVHYRGMRSEASFHSSLAKAFQS